ncbi:MAG TPA: peptidoglycan-binding domain-containing protein [Thermoleophilaceae bacterium]|nr:peptidoglycan-binding domain-containing protein [Thermoleophilaceae bacterium]
MAIFALPVVAAATVGVVAATGIDGGGGNGARAAGQKGPGRTVTVARRTLVDRQNVDGTLGFSGKRSVLNRLSGTVTWLPHVGQVIHPGQTLLRVDGHPVVLMDGALPAYRTLKSGVADGADVRQLERGLQALGYNPGVVDEHYSASTATAVRAWQDDLGLDKTGQVELGRVVFLPGVRRVTDVKASLGSAASASSGADNPGDGMRFASYNQNAANVGNGNNNGNANGNGGGNNASTEVLVTSSTRRVVTAKLDAADQLLVSRGQRVRVELPDGRFVGGRITSVGTVATADSNSNNDPNADSTPKISITIQLRSARAAGRFDQAPVSVQLARTTRRHVLAVPVQALVARRGGSYAVELQSGRLVRVIPGLFANGYVELTGGRIHEGDRVRVPQ